jgi:LacI family transcriptional regulator
MRDVASRAGMSLKTFSRVINSEPGVAVVTATSRERGYPAGDTPVVFDRPPVGLAADAVLLDDFGGARTAVEHLLAHGHRRIAVVGDAADLFTAAARLAGYRHALEAAGIPVADELIRLGTQDAAQAERVVGFDDFELADLPATPVTVVRHDSQRMGTHAAALAFARLDGGDHAARQVIIPTELVVRGSGEIAPP